MNEAEKEFKKLTERISETHDTMQVVFKFYASISGPFSSGLRKFHIHEKTIFFQASYMELMAETQANTNRVCKTTIPELLQSVDKAIDTLRTRYGIA
ncbi:hypothetical protein HanRHA438_Chr17g0797221 [Helianthus annuus]|nr:hypothetical protein HanHA300_Chr17g0641201 [Helianthus annuus]KAJ0446298.1 hypothetical protein HanHA89_Chr17g0692791 [Helianthus annuus]KAJ0631253.1 hypothetical protein HanLR1_Chr17g0652001 [Helianthus annuus]KAJ0635135.1 hypothetical protein HanOQP8_Chr17g0647561 [Helianthus annuus]KAJ0824884.1 hypothetical protein HanRHA438_Chr17g0797221 [Helianthus annuus]